MSQPVERQPPARMISLPLLPSQYHCSPHTHQAHHHIPGSTTALSSSFNSSLHHSSVLRTPGLSFGEPMWEPKGFKRPFFPFSLPIKNQNNFIACTAISSTYSASLPFQSGIHSIFWELQMIFRKLQKSRLWEQRDPGYPKQDRLVRMWHCFKKRERNFPFCFKGETPNIKEREPVLSFGQWGKNQMGTCSEQKQYL